MIISNLKVKNMLTPLNSLLPSLPLIDNVEDAQKIKINSHSKDLTFISYNVFSFYFSKS
jgi:hypothetical protein